jgi:hypothetical protein
MVNKLKRIRWAEHIAGMRRWKKAYNALDRLLK